MNTSPDPNGNMERQIEIIKLLTEIRDELRKKNAAPSKKTV
jgi:hypothetical protein